MELVNEHATFSGLSLVLLCVQIARLPNRVDDAASPYHRPMTETREAPMSFAMIQRLVFCKTGYMRGGMHKVMNPAQLAEPPNHLVGNCDLCDELVFCKEDLGIDANSEIGAVLDSGRLWVALPEEIVIHENPYA